jgi:hypothetical protein
MNIINKRLLPVIPFILMLISACSNNSQNDSVKINALNEGLTISNSLIHYETSVIYKSLEKKLAEHDSKAIIWYPKAMMIKMYSDSIRNFIERLKMDLQEEKSPENKVQLLFETNNKGNELYHSLLTYKNSILNIDPELEKIFKDKTVIVTQPFDSLNSNQEDFTKTFFHKASKEMALSILNRFENNIDIAEQETVTFCNFQVVYYDDGIRTFSALIGQSTTHARPGELIDISAGVGSYSVKCNPRIKIDGVAVPVNSDGIANYHFKASDKPGKHSVGVIIDYIDDGGSSKSDTTNIHYFVTN